MHHPWYIVHTKPKQEFIAETNLLKQQISVYLPVYKKSLRRSRRRVNANSPLFAGYLFAQFDWIGDYYRVRYTKGVKHILGTPDCHCTIPYEKIADIRNREQDGVVQLQKRNSSLHQGDDILIDEGDFQGWEGIFQEFLPDHQRAIILLTNIRYSSKLVIPIRFLTRKSL